MKPFPVFFALGVALAVGCGKQDGAQPAKSTNDAAAIGNPLTAPVDYLGAVAQAKKSSEKTIDTVYLNQAIQLFHTSEGRYPKDLNELTAEGFIPRIPDAPNGMKIIYDAARGVVTVVQQPQTNAAPARR
jgi:hypothetical protein